MFTEFVHERHKAPADAGKRRWRSCIIVPPFFSRMFSLALTSRIFYMIFSSKKQGLSLQSQTKEMVLEALHLVQHFDPVGVTARDMRECLLIQARFQILGVRLLRKSSWIIWGNWKTGNLIRLPKGFRFQSNRSSRQCQSFRGWSQSQAGVIRMMKLYM